VPILPHISNHTDFDALRLHPNVDFQFVKLGESIPPADLIMRPGSKNIRSDIEHLHDHGWQQALAQHLRYGGKVIGICGGFQMLGQLFKTHTALRARLAQGKVLAGWNCKLR